MTRQRPRRLITTGIAALAVGLALTVAGVLPPSANAAEPTIATLHEAHVGATNPGFQTGTCPTPPGDATWGWHFVLPGDDTVFVTISVTFESAGVITDFISAPTGKHAYVFTPGPDTLLAATATVDGPATTFVLSHVCAGSSTTTTTTEQPTTTTTEQPTTTTTEQPTTTTTEQPTTTTTEQPTTTTTEQPTTTTTEQPTTTERPTTTEQPTTTAPAGAAAAAEVLGTTEAATLPRTGAPTTLLLALGLSFLAGGLLLLLAARRSMAT